MYQWCILGRKNMKKLLKESEIRKMMKFANIGALTNTFVEKLNEAGLYDEEQELMDPEYEDAPEDELGLEEPVGLDEPEGDDLDLEEPAGDLGGATVEAGLEGLNAFLEAAIEHPDEIREKVNVELSDEPALDEPMPDEPMPDEPMPDEDEDADMPPSPDMGMDSPEDELEEAQIELEEDDYFVNEVVRRVAKRLLKK
tara:strand:+ start:24 stop:617 length:594 start_codon:yes stop_codon:yes gene_type:complete